MKSETASVRIPEIDLELLSGTLGGKYTTLEGILVDIKDQLSKNNPFVMGDSSRPENRLRFAQFIEQLEKLNEVKNKWTFEMDDPLGNIYLYSENPELDPNLTVTHYERSFEQNEELGLNDINTDPMSYLETDEEKQLYLKELDNEGQTNAANKKSLHHTSNRNDPFDSQPLKYGGKIKPEEGNDPEVD